MSSTIRSLSHFLLVMTNTATACGKYAHLYVNLCLYQTNYISIVQLFTEQKWNSCEERVAIKRNIDAEFLFRHESKAFR